LFWLFMQPSGYTILSWLLSRYLTLLY